MLVAVVSVVVVLLLTGATLLLTGALDKGKDDDRDGSPTARSTPPAAKPTAEPEKTEEPVEEIPGETIGTPENPYSPGDTFTIMKHWTFTLGATDTDAWPEVAHEYEGKDYVDQYQPDPGTVFVMAPLDMVYTGPPDAPERVDIGYFFFVGPDGTENHGMCGRYHTTFDVFEEDLIEKKTSESAPICVATTPDVAASGLWEIALFTYDANGKEGYVEIYYTTS